MPIPAAQIPDADDEGSVTIVIRKMKAGDERGADLLWQRFHDRIKTLVRSRLHPAHSQIADEEDVALESLAELFRGLLKGKFQDLSNRNDFWRLLVTVATRNVIDQVNREKTQKRGGGRVHNETAIRSETSVHSTQLFDRIPSTIPTPEAQSMITENVARLLESLKDGELQTIALMKAAGSNNQEVSDQMGISLRSVERRLREIRERWSAQADA